MLNKKLEEIYAAGLRIFSKYGFKKSTVEDVAAELGWTKGALYQYVESKQDLYKKCASYGFKRWQERVLSKVEEIVDIKLRFETMCLKAFQYLKDDTELRELLIKDPDLFPLSFEKDPYKDINSDSKNFMRDILEKGVKSGDFAIDDIDLTVRLLFSIYKMVIIETYVLAEHDTNRVFKTCIALVTNGFYK